MYSTAFICLYKEKKTIINGNMPALQCTIAKGSEVYSKNSPALKKVCGSQEGHCKKRCEIQGGGQEMAVMVG